MANQLIQRLNSSSKRNKSAERTLKLKKSTKEILYLPYSDQWIAYS